MDPKFIGKPPATAEIERMPERGSHHRRSHSDTSFRFAGNFDDLLLFDPSDLDISNLPSPIPIPSPAAAASGGGVPMNIDSDESSGQSGRGAGAPIGHLRSLSVDSDFFDGLGFSSAATGGGEEKFGGKEGGGERRMKHHRHSNSMDGSSTSFDADSSSMIGIDGVKKAMAPDKLAELALMDPKRAKRVLANRQSAARSKERKIRYTNELEKKVQTLQAEATNLAAQLTVLTRSTTDLTALNKELKIRLEAMEQEAQLREELQAALREEVQRLKERQNHPGAVSSSNAPLGGMYSQLTSQFAMQQLNPPPQQPQLSVPPPPPPPGQRGQRRPNFVDFNQKN